MFRSLYKKIVLDSSFYQNLLVESKQIIRGHKANADHWETKSVKLEQSLINETKLRKDTEKGYWALVARLREYAPGIAEHNRRGLLLPKPFVQQQLDMEFGTVDYKEPPYGAKYVRTSCDD